MISLIYFLLFIAFVLALGLLNSIRLENKKTEVKKLFKNKWANKLYQYSFYMPFIWFIDEKETNPKTKVLKDNLAQSNLTHLFNYRSFTTMKVGILISSIVSYAFIILIINNGGAVARFLFNIKEAKEISTETNSTFELKVVIFLVLLVLTLIPNIYLKQRAKKYRLYHTKDIPVVQMFIILMLRSKKPIAEILYALSKINTRYRGTFDIGYRMYIRNKEDGLNYIDESFGETNFKETIKVLKEMGEYSREDSIKLLENNMEQMVEKNNTTKRRGDLSRMVYSQSTLAIPFIAIIILGFAPIAMFGLNLMSGVELGFK